MALAARNLGKQFGDVRALAGLDLTIPAGSIVGLVGNNGAGKTTTLKLMCGLLAPSTGTACIDGLDATRPAARQGLGFVPEDSPLYDEMTPLAYLAFFARVYDLPPAPARARAEELLTRLRLDAAFWRKPIGDLSKGSARKVALARALLHDPANLILDEPASGLDPATRRELDEVIRGLRAAGKAVLLSAHNLRQVEELCDEVVLLAGGRIIAQGPLADLRRQWGRPRYRVHASVPFATRETRSLARGGIHFAQLEGNDALQEALAAVQAAGGSVLEVESEPPTLEEVLERAARGTA